MVYAILDASGTVIDSDHTPLIGRHLAQLARITQARLLVVPMKNGLSLCCIKTYDLTERGVSVLIPVVTATTETEAHSVPGVTEAIEAWATARRAEGLAAKYVSLGRNVVVSFASDAGWTRLGQDVQGDAERYLAAIDNAKSRNNKLVCFRRFLAYSKARGWVASNWANEIPLARVKTKQRRQAYTDGQYADLVHAGRAAEARGCKPRALGYMLAWHCGLRRGEIERLDWADIRLDGDPPHVLVRAAKGGEDQEVPIVSTDLMHTLRAAHAVDGKVLPRGLPHNREARADAVRAGIPRVNKWGEISAPWHSLRHGFCTRLAASGINVQTAQTLMRHRSVQQTMRYTNQRMMPQIEALRSLEGEKNISQILHNPIDRRQEMSDDTGVMTVEPETTREAQVDARRHHKPTALNVLPGSFFEAGAGSLPHSKHPRQDSNLPPGVWAQALTALAAEQRIQSERLRLLIRLTGGGHGRAAGRDAGE